MTDPLSCACVPSEEFVSADGQHAHGPLYVIVGLLPDAGKCPSYLPSCRSIRQRTALPVLRFAAAEVCPQSSPTE